MSDKEINYFCALCGLDLLTIKRGATKSILLNKKVMDICPMCWFDYMSPKIYEEINIKFDGTSITKPFLYFLQNNFSRRELYKINENPKIERNIKKLLKIPSSKEIEVTIIESVINYNICKLCTERLNTKNSIYFITKHNKNLQVCEKCYNDFTDKEELDE